MDYSALTVVKLKDELKTRGLPSSQIKFKKDMIICLLQDDIKKASHTPASSATVVAAPVSTPVPAPVSAPVDVPVSTDQDSEYGSDDLFDELDADALISASQQSPPALLSTHSSFALQHSPTLKRSLPQDEGDFLDDEMPVKDNPEHVALVRRLLKDKFGYSGFRGEQEKAILSILRGENTLAIFPTGAGKSLCYQIPAIAFPELDKASGNVRPHGAGITLVVSPLIALMKDQTDALKKRGIAADCSDSTKTYERHQQIHAEIHAGRLRLLYVSPEKLNNETFVASMKHIAGGVRLVAVDEAHCISEWGHR